MNFINIVILCLVGWLILTWGETSILPDLMKTWLAESDWREVDFLQVVLLLLMIISYLFSKNNPLQIIPAKKQKSHSPQEPTHICPQCQKTFQAAELGIERYTWGKASTETWYICPNCEGILELEGDRQILFRAVVAMAGVVAMGVYAVFKWGLASFFVGVGVMGVMLYGVHRAEKKGTYVLASPKRLSRYQYLKSRKW